VSPEASRESRAIVDAPYLEPDLGQIYVATGNHGKLREMHALFAHSGYELVLFQEYESPVEGVQSYTENAALKARSLHAVLRAQGRSANVLADDSGLEVRALDGRPGVTTADYGGAAATWPERRRMLLAELTAAATLDRRARFVCAMHFIGATGREFGSFGTVDGLIASGEQGELGFSFDPIFHYPPAARTFAELNEAEKNRVSHRAIASAAVIAAIRASRVDVRASNGV
jgi:non-canonical purine NTP pyrophosphatase (RdgB/HAM1 family)